MTEAGGGNSGSSSIVCVSVDAANVLVTKPVSTTPPLSTSYNCKGRDVNGCGISSTGDSIPYSDWGGIYSNGWGAPKPTPSPFIHNFSSGSSHTNTASVGAASNSSSSSSTPMAMASSTSIIVLRDSDVPILVTQVGTYVFVYKVTHE